MAGQLRVDEITDEAGTGSPSFPFGLPVGYAAGGTAPAAGSFTEVPSNVLEVGDPIRSVDILAIKENTNYNHQNTVLEILNEQTFNTSGTWTKPSGFDPDDTIVVVAIGGGGSGGAITENLTNNHDQFGGSGGSVGYLSMRYADAPSTAVFGIGGGGSAVTTTTSANGTNGGFTIFGQADSIDFFGLLRPSGGRRGRPNFTNPVANTECFSRVKFPTTTTLRYEVNVTGLSITREAVDYSIGRAADRSSGGTDHQVGKTGGGGAVGFNNGTLNTDMIEGHKGTIYGEGGNGGANANAQDGGFPGGGGGSCRRLTGVATSGAGGNGQLIVYVCRGRVSASQFQEFSHA